MRYVLPGPTPTSNYRMRREYFTLEVSDADTSGIPTIHIDFEGPSDQLAGRLTDGEGEPLDPDEIDVAYRLQASADGDVDGVLAVTNRVTGEFILELNAGTDEVLEFIRAVREHGSDSDDRRYRLRLSIDGERSLDHRKGTFLVYDEDGGLLRKDSLIPSGVEL